MKKVFKKDRPEFEEIFADKLGSEENIIEVSLNKSAFNGVKAVFAVGVLAAVLQLSFLSFVKGQAYQNASFGNQNQQIYSSAPRGIIYDSFGNPLVQNQIKSFLYLDLNAYAKNQDEEPQIEKIISDALGMNIQDFLNAVGKIDYQHANQMLLANNLSVDQVIAVKSANLKSLIVKDGYNRFYPNGPIFSSVVGYVGLPTGDDLKNKSGAFIDSLGRSGLEAYYNSQLAGKPGIVTNFRDAQGRLISSGQTQPPANGADLHLAIDSQFQEFFYQSLQKRLYQLGLTTGLGIAMNPQNGEVLALFNIPSFDNNDPAPSLNSPLKPLFDRAVSGLYSPGSTIKPLDGLALLSEKLIDPKTQIFSPGYLDVPNPYNPAQPSRFLDWRYQGWVNLESAIAWSSDVYFYATVGGLPAGQTAVSVSGGQPINPLGIDKLNQWWQKFKLGDLTGIDLPNEANGFLPTPDWKENKFRQPWRTGDTYNVAIGQGDLLLTPIRLLTYISAIANGGKIYQPFIDKDYNQPKVVSDLSYLAPEIKEIQAGMRLAVTDPLGTAYTLDNLPFAVGAKTGSAQINNNAKENAFFVGYAPYDNPQIAILVLIENSREGSLNTLPVAKEVLNWYYENRLNK